MTIVAPGLGPDRVSRNTYDAANRVTVVTQGYGSANPIAVATSTYTANGKVQTLADGSGHLTTYAYDGFDRTQRMYYPNSSGGGSNTGDYQEYAYDAASNVTQLRQRDGSTITNAYDNLNRPTQTAPSTSDPTIQYSYDLLGHQLTQSYAGGQVLTFTFDALGRNLTQQSSVLGTVQYQYDLAGRRTQMTWPDGFYVSYDSNLYGQTTAIRENGASSGPGVLASYNYDGLGRRSLLTRGNGTTQTPGYDNAYNLASLAQTATNSGYNQTYAYTSNALGQSLSRTGSNAAYQWAPLAPGAVTLTANGLNQYTSVGGTSFSYDGRGNLTGDGSRSYGFDVYNRLTGVSGAGSMSLAYDPAGRLYETAASGATTRFLYDGANLIGEYDTSGNLLRRYVQGAGSNEQLVWYEGSGTSDRRYLVQDELGTVIAADGPSGVTTYSYDEYGNPNTWNGPAPAPRFRYAGAIMLPEAQLYSMRARGYSPGIGRFLQTDPILFNGGMNLYAYTGNDPVNAIDPSGLEDVTPIELPICKLGEDCDISHLGCPDGQVCETVTAKAAENEPKLSRRPQSMSLPVGGIIYGAGGVANGTNSGIESIQVDGYRVTNEETVVDRYSAVCPAGYYVKRMLTTGYDNGYNSTQNNPGDKGYGITNSGQPTGPGTIAIDPRDYRFGTPMYVPGYGWGIARDTGGKIKSDHIDLWFPTEQEAKNWGKPTKDVVICK